MLYCYANKSQLFLDINKKSGICGIDGLVPQPLQRYKATPKTEKVESCQGYGIILGLVLVMEAGLSVYEF